jgi:hypothetical protein
MFFLKCLDDDSEVDGLIRREIEAREWFLLCDSTSSRASLWVTREVEIIKGLPDRVYEAVDLEADLSTQIGQANKLAKRATVFLSYARSDTAAAFQMAAVFERHDYAVFTDLSVLPGMEWQAEIFSRINEAEQRGFVIALISVESMHSQWVRSELEYAVARRRELGRGYGVVPVLLSGWSRISANGDPALTAILDVMQAVDFAEGSIEANTEMLISHLKSREMR